VAAFFERIAGAMFILEQGEGWLTGEILERILRRTRSKRNSMRVGPGRLARNVKTEIRYTAVAKGGKSGD